MLERASGSLLTTLVTLRPLLGVWDPLIPDLILRPRKPLDFGELQQPVRRDTTRFFGTRSQVPTDWAAQAIKLERPRLNRTSMDQRRRRKGSVAGRPRNFTPCTDIPKKQSRGTVKDITSTCGANSTRSRNGIN